jgi:prepilin-type N-terminal cleavage/methylation domain-containing protein
MNKKQSGVTLIELTVVLLILVALAGLVSPYVGGTGQKAMCEATDVSMQNIKKVIMENYYVDTLGKYPKRTRTTTPDYNLTCLFEKCDWQDFDPVTNVGFRKGGYLQSGVQLGSEWFKYLDTSFNDNGVHVNNNLTTNDLVILDAWGRPIILQIPLPTDCPTITGIAGTTDCARLVSAGFGHGVGISEAYCSDSTYTTKTTCEANNKHWIGMAAIETPLDGNKQNGSDDRILYLNIPTPAADINTPCDQY